MAVLAFIATAAEQALVIHGKWLYSLNALVQLIRFTNAAYALTMVLVKISIGLFFLKLFATSFKWQRILIWTLMSVGTVMGTAYLIMTFATCGIMVQSQVSTPLHTGTAWCPIQTAFVHVSIAWSCLNSIADIVYVLLAMQVLWISKMNRATKVSAGALLVFGSIGCIASVARIAVQLPLTDVRMSGILLGEWSNIEAGISITAASLMTLRPLFQKGLERARSTMSSRSKATNGSGASSTPSTDHGAHELDKMEMGKASVMVTTTYSVMSKDSDSWSQKSQEIKSSPLSS